MPREHPRSAGAVASRPIHLAVVAALAAAPVATLAADDDPPKVEWTLELSSDSKGGAHAADIDGDGDLEIVFGTYFGDERLRAVDAKDGSVLWEKKSDGGPFDASVAIADLDGDGDPEILSADSATGRLFCLDGQGRELWNLRLPSGTDSPPSIGDLDGDGRPEVVIGTMWRPGGVGVVCAIDPRKRAILWQADVAGCVQTAPALADLDLDGKLDVIVGSWRGDRGVHALRGLDGSPLFRFETRGNDRSMGMYHGVSVHGAGDDLRIIAATCDGDVHALDRTGKLLWRRHLDDYLFAATTIADLDGDGDPDVLVGGRRLYALELADGRELWRRDDLGSIDRGAAVLDVDGEAGLEVVLAAGTRLLVLDAASGETRRSWDAARDPADRLEKISSAPLVADLDGDGKLEAFVVCGRGYSGELAPKNGARAFVVELGPGRGPAWTTFRGGLRRTGTAVRGRRLY